MCERMEATAGIRSRGGGIGRIQRTEHRNINGRRMRGTHQEYRHIVKFKNFINSEKVEKYIYTHTHRTKHQYKMIFIYFYIFVFDFLYIFKL